MLPALNNPPRFRQPVIPFLLLLLSLQTLNAADLEKTAVRFLPHWLPQAQFAGFYTAADQGFYAEAGLEVEILPGGPDHPPSQLLPAGQTDFATMFLTNGMILRGENKPILHLAQLMHESSLMLVTHRDSEIRKPADLEGKKVAIWHEFRAQPLALFRKYEIDPFIIEQGSTMGIFQQRGADAACAMRYNELQWLYLAGFNQDELNLIELKNHGVGFPEDGIYASEDFIKNNPETVAAFIKASLKGWDFAFAHPDKAVDSVMIRIREAGRRSSRAHQRRMLESLRNLYLDENGKLPSPRLRKTDFERASNALQLSGDLEKPFPYESFHHPAFPDR